MCNCSRFESVSHVNTGLGWSQHHPTAVCCVNQDGLFDPENSCRGDVADHSDTGTVVRKEDKGLPSEEHTPGGLDAIACHLPCWASVTPPSTVTLLRLYGPGDLGSLVAVVPSYWTQKAEVSLQHPRVARPRLQGDLSEHCAEMAVLPTLGTCRLL